MYCYPDVDVFLSNFLQRAVLCCSGNTILSVMSPRHIPLDVEVLLSEVIVLTMFLVILSCVSLPPAPRWNG